MRAEAATGAAFRGSLENFCPKKHKSHQQGTNSPILSANQNFAYNTLRHSPAFLHTRPIRDADILIYKRLVRH